MLFGPHINLSTGAVIEATKELRPPVIKVLEYDETFLRWIKENAPDTFVIGRLYVGDQVLGRTPEEAEALGTAFANRILQENITRLEVNGKKLIDAWEGYNEVVHSSTSDEDHIKYDHFQLTFRARLVREGFEAIGLNFATGNMDGPRVYDLYPRTLTSYKYLGFHEYDFPTMDRLHLIGLNKPNEPHNWFPGCEQRGDGGCWLALRYRRIMNYLRTQYGDKHEVFITEFGMTQGSCGGHDIGFRAEINTTANCQETSVPIPENAYWETLKWYHSEIVKDSYVKGATLFCCGCPRDWSTFEATNFIPRFRELVQPRMT